MDRVRHKQTRLTDRDDATGLETTFSGTAIVVSVGPLASKERKRLHYLCGQWDIKLTPCEWLADRGREEGDTRKRNDDCGASAYLAMCHSADAERVQAAMDWITSPVTRPTYIVAWNNVTNVRVLMGQGNGQEKERKGTPMMKPHVHVPGERPATVPAEQSKPLKNREWMLTKQQD